MLHHGGNHHGGALVKHVFHLDAGNVLSTRNDDVLAAVLDLDIAIKIDHGEVTPVKPATMKRLGSVLGAAQRPLHHDVAAEHDLAQRLSIVRHLLLGLRVVHRGSILQGIAHALACVQACPLRQG